MKMFDDLVQGLNEAIEYEKGTGKARAAVFSITPVPEYSRDEIKRVRNSAGMSQRTFASYLGVSVKTVEAWENGRTHPVGSACRLMEILSSPYGLELPFVKKQL